ncbi:MAG: YqgE/AlgH family protein [Actinomycetota bacterium]|nr:YqgE/AlgH family protein [Actinomycetota bacterium]
MADEMADGMADGMAPSGELKGRLLVATPALGDPNFDHTVVLVLEHGEEGAVGVVLNRPTTTDLAHALPTWHPLAAEPKVLFSGGPVAPDAAICLGKPWPGEEAEGYEPLFGAVGTVDLTLEVEDLAPALQGIRIFVGYAGWDEGQLEGEIEAGAWFVVDSHPDDAMSPEPDDLWRSVLRRQGGSLAMFANFPPNPAMN